jgi:CPA2 family monovalent cation:H+ antiporter-2
VPLLIVIPALSAPPERLFAVLGLATLKIAIALGLILYFGQSMLRRWFHVVARRQSHELFMLNLLLVTLGMAYLTSLFGLSLALGAFLAGMLISETEYRHQVEADIKPFRDVLLGLFFVTVGMQLQLRFEFVAVGRVLLLALLLIGVKCAVTIALSRALGSSMATAIRTGLGLAQAGEFGFVLLAQADAFGTGINIEWHNALLAAMVLSMFAAPFLIQHSDRLALKFSAAEFYARSLALHKVAVQSMNRNWHVLICGYGRSGQNVARFLEQEQVPYVALDFDPERVREAAAAGDTVVFGDAARRETLQAAGVGRAECVVVSYSDTGSTLQVLRLVRELNPGIPVLARTRDEADIDRLVAAGATEVVPETLECAVMLATHALVLRGLPLRRVLRRIQALRDERYGLLRAFFHGASDAEQDLEDAGQPRLHSVRIGTGAFALARDLTQLRLAELGVQVKSIRRADGLRQYDPEASTKLGAGDVVVLLGTPSNLALAESRLLQGSAPLKNYRPAVVAGLLLPVRLVLVRLPCRSGTDWYRCPRSWHPTRRPRPL